MIRHYFKQSIENDADIISPSLHHLLRASDIEVDVECTDWEDAVRKSGNPLVEKGYMVRILYWQKDLLCHMQKLKKEVFV